MLRPSALVVERLIASFNFVGCCTGSSAGLAQNFLGQSFQLSFDCIY